ncbi:hypothetical protein BSKO_02541 [Bryopsis sp. KO-2023]|nr:hypothetical protein BSKO_02541 [Bryopsis sp. KO-2023]
METKKERGKERERGRERERMSESAKREKTAKNEIGEQDVDGNTGTGAVLMTDGKKVRKCDIFLPPGGKKREKNRKKSEKV